MDHFRHSDFYLRQLLGCFQPSAAYILAEIDFVIPTSI